MNKKILFLIIISIILGLLVARQFLLSEKIKKEVNVDTSQTLAYEVSELFNSNEKLKDEIEKLSVEVEALQKTFQNTKEANETLDEKIKKYEIILGKKEIRGQGVRIKFDKKIASIQIIDLVNALKNIGAEAISINGKRLLPTGSIIEGIFSPTVTVEAIGDKEILHSSLTRSGGIIDQIGYGQVTSVDDIIIPIK